MPLLPLIMHARIDSMLHGKQLLLKLPDLVVFPMRGLLVSASLLRFSLNSGSRMNQLLLHERYFLGPLVIWGVNFMLTELFHRRKSISIGVAVSFVYHN